MVVGAAVRAAVLHPPLLVAMVMILVMMLVISAVVRVAIALVGEVGVVGEGPWLRGHQGTEAGRRLTKQAFRLRVFSKPQPR